MAQKSKTFSGDLSTATSQVVARQQGRQLLEIQNQDPSIEIFLAFGKDATSADYRIPPDSVYTAPTFNHDQSRNHTMTGSVNLIAASGTPAFAANVEWVS